MQVGAASQGNWQQQVYSGPPSKGEKLVARHDKDNDGKLSMKELEGTRLGKRMSVDRFARMDKNDDGMLDASEFGRKKAGRGASASVMERVMVARMADFLAEKVPDKAPEPLPAEDIAAGVIARLDKDGSEGLNSEEIAGTRVAEQIGAGFYDVDADKNGALDKSELTGFLKGESAVPAEESAPAETAAPAPTEDAAPVAAEDAAPVAPTPVAEEAEPVAATDQADDAPPAAAEETRVAKETVTPAPDKLPGEDVADGVIARLDTDGSAGLNSEEIAGTRLADIIGPGLYDIDADKNGALDKAELTDFLAGASDAAAAELGAVQDTAAPAPAASSEPSYADKIRASFEAALELLQSGQNQQSAYDAVSALYGEVKSILGG